MNSPYCLQLFLPNSEHTKRLGELLGKHLPPGSNILLQGDLGTGKTTLIQGLGESLGITDPIASPTFTLINEYTEGRIPLYHLDLYRLEPEQVNAIYPEIYWEGEEVTPGITAIEWSERLPYKPNNYLEINLTHHKKRGRQATLNLLGRNDLNLDFLLDMASTKLN
jgi:tRNA threonylcarbamoyladenosine biosynthesis protein TsaE